MDEARGLVLVVEDERHIADLERLYLDRAGFGVHVETDGTGGLAAARRLRPALIVLDVGLPGIDGIDICSRLRADGDWTPIIFVTARDEEVDRVVGLELGADDYLTKPFSPRELVARVKSVLRRHNGVPDRAPLSLGRIRVDQASRTASVDGHPVELTATEFDLLGELISHPEQVFSRQQLLSSVWGHADYSSGRTVDVHIAQLRSKLGDASPIRTVHGIGYAARAE
jgi:DNA-binding response OmpR family regulator